VSTSPQDLPLLSRRGGAWGGIWSAVVVAALAVLVVIEWSPLLSVDTAVATWFHDWGVRNDWAVTLALWLDRIGEIGVAFWVALAVVLLLVSRRRYWQALTLALVATLAPLATHYLKLVVQRPRPTWDVVLATDPEFSFPSGHATSGIAVYAACGVALGSLLRNRSGGAWVVLPFVLLGVAIGVSRLVLGLHYPSDVVAGWCVALAFAGITGALFVLPPYVQTHVRPRARR